MPLYIKLLQINAFANNNKYTNFLVHDKKVLKQYNKIWGRVNNLFKTEFDSKPVYNDKYIKAKIPKKEHYIYFAVLLLGSIIQ